MSASLGPDEPAPVDVDLEEVSIDVLLIEDDPAVLEMYQLKLSLDGYHVSVATDGEAGVARAIELRPDIIFLDIRLPKKDGFAVLQELREREETKEIPVIILSNYGEQDLVERGLKLGALEYVIKADTTPSSLSGGIGRWLGQQSSMLSAG
ncbi:MAG TPA: response regulator [Candidatus Dormibacteraeota bacterium]